MRIMDDEALDEAQETLAALDALVTGGPETPHDEIAEAMRRLAGLRNRIIEKAREGKATPECRDRANALMSLAYGAEFPLIGFHHHRIVQTRDGLRALVAECGAQVMKAKPT